MEGIQATGAESRLPAGSGELKYVYTADGTVLHRPLYFEDWAEECGSDDDQFAWTGEDFLYILEGPVWFMANAVAFPVEAVINPPWCVMASDCVPGCRRCWLRHDAARWCGCTHQNGPQAAAVAHKEVVE
jgi:hypothetical protein